MKNYDLIQTLKRNNQNMRNIDMSSLTPAQRQQAELMQEFTSTPEMRSAFTLVNLAEKILPHLLESEHRQEPKTAAQAALAYAAAMHDAGEASMQAQFELWKASRPTEPAPALDNDVLGAVDDNAHDVDSDPVGGVVQEETISRDSAVADTVERTGRGEDVMALATELPHIDPATELPHVDPAAASVVPGFGAVDQ